jgi:hypothetical protein
VDTSIVRVFILVPFNICKKIVGAMRGLVEGQISLGDWKDKLKADPTQLMAAYIATAQGQNNWNGAADVGRRGR